MPRTLKSGRGSGFGRRGHSGKKTAEQKQAEAAGRLFRSMTEKRVRQDNPRMTEKQIRQEVRRRIAERKDKPKTVLDKLSPWRLG